MRQYLDLLQDVLDHGIEKQDRTGVGTRSVFGRQLRFPLDPFPIVTTKKVHWKSVVVELLWMLSGSTNAQELEKQGVTIWKEWADPETGALGPVYGHQWRSWDIYRPFYDRNGEHYTEHFVFDQVDSVLKQLISTPDSRRMLVSAWNAGVLNEMKLPPCHYSWQLYTEPIPRRSSRRLSLHMTQRSVDVFLGLPFNISSYALLACLIASVTPDMLLGELIISLGDTHLYQNHLEQSQVQLTREPLPLPQLVLQPKLSLFEYKPDDILLCNYQHHPAIKADVAV